jgi:Zn-dependent protease with chaperone function
VLCPTCGGIVQPSGRCAPCDERAAEAAAREAELASKFCSDCGAALDARGGCPECAKRAAAVAVAATPLVATSHPPAPVAPAAAPAPRATDCPHCGTLGVAGAKCANCGNPLPLLSVVERETYATAPRSVVCTADFRHKSELLVFIGSLVALVAVWGMAVAISLLITVLGTCGIGLIFEVPIIALVIGIFFWGLYMRYSYVTKQLPEVTDATYPDLAAVANIAARRLNYDLPPVYLDVNASEPNATAECPYRSLVVVTRGLTETLSPQGLLYVIGHEVGHLKCWHVPMLMVMRNDLAMAQISRAGWLVWLPMQITQLVMLWWDRLAEYSADRAGLIASGSLTDCITALYAVHHGADAAGKADLEEFVRKSYATPDWDEALAAVGATHPTLRRRIKGLIEYYMSPEYAAIAAAQNAAASAPS